MVVSQVKGIPGQMQMGSWAADSEGTFHNVHAFGRGVEGGSGLFAQTFHSFASQGLCQAYFVVVYLKIIFKALQISSLIHFNC